MNTVSYYFEFPYDIDFHIIKFLDKYSFHNFLEYKKKENYIRYFQLITSINKIINKNYDCLGLIEEIYLNIGRINSITMYSDYKYKIFKLYVHLNAGYEICEINKQIINFYSNSNFDSEKQKKKFENITKSLNNKLLIFGYNSKLRYEPTIKTKKFSINLTTYLDIKSNLLK